MARELFDARDDLDWLTEVHKVPTDGIVIAILYGNVDAPDRVDAYAVDNVNADPYVYIADDSGTLRREYVNNA